MVVVSAWEQDGGDALSLRSLPNSVVLVGRRVTLGYTGTSGKILTNNCKSGRNVKHCMR
jgi:hypothetical protein